MSPQVQSPKDGENQGPCPVRQPVGTMAAASSGEKDKERPGGGLGAAGGNSTRERLLSALEDLEVLSR